MMTSLLPFLILSCMLYKTVVAQVLVSADNQSPTNGDVVKLTCSITSFTLPSSWINDTSSGILSTCLAASICSVTTSGRYSYSVTASTMVVQIQSYNDFSDNFGWKCRHDNYTYIFKFAPSTSTSLPPTTVIPPPGNPCAQNDLAYGLGVGLCITILCIIILLVIIIVIFRCISHRFWLFILLGFIIVVVLCIICIVIILVTGDQCPLKLGLGLGIGLGIATVTCIIFILILVLVNKVLIQNKDTLQSQRPDGEEVKITAIIYGFWISGVEWIRGENPLPNSTNGEYTIVPYDSNKRETSLIIKNFSMAKIETYICRTKGRFGCSAQDSITIPHDKKKKKTGSRSDVSRKDVEIQMEENGLKNNEERLLVIPNRIGTKDESETEHVLSKPFDPKERRPLPPLNEKDKPNHRPQPIPSETNDVKDQNLRGLSANFDDTQGLASEMPRPSKKLPPIQQQVQSTVQEEGTSEEPKKKKKNRKKKDKIDEGKSADEIAE